MRSLIVTSLIISTSLMALTAKVEKPLSVLEGTSVGKYIKPGAPVNIRYKTTQVEVGDVSKVSIVLTSTATTGSMHTKIVFDNGLTNVVGDRTDKSFTLTKQEKSFPLNFQVSALKEGLYYIKLLVEVKGKGMRAFSVPVRIGSGELKREKTPIEKSSSGENMTVMRAVEVIER